MPERKFTTLLVLLVISAFIFSISGCQQPAKKPPAKPVKMASEVKKYNKEPGISLYRTATGAKQQLKMEEYLKGVLAAEMNPKFPMEALKAQAIVARTMTLALLEYEMGLGLNMVLTPVTTTWNSSNMTKKRLRIIYPGQLMKPEGKF